MHKSLLIVMLLLIASALGTLWWQSGASGAPAPVAPPTVGDAGRTPPADVAAASGDVAPHGDAVDRSVPEGLFRTAVENEVEVRYLVLQVWDRKQGVPASAAEVFLLDDLENANIDWDVTKGPFAQHWSDVAELRGRRFRTDDEGRVEVPNVKGNAIVAAKQPGAYGFRLVGEKHAEVEMITLQADETVTVRVVDDDGWPVAMAPVGVLQRVQVRDSFGELTSRMRALEKAMRDIEAWMQANPAQRDAAMDKMNAVRREYGQVRRQIGQQKGDDGGKRAQRRVAAARKQVQRPDTRVEFRARRRTDENGLAVFRHFQVYRKDPRQGNGKGRGKDGGKRTASTPNNDFEAVLLMPLQQPQGRRFTGDPVPDETIELRMPATGTIALRTVDLDGRPFTHPVHAELRMLAENGAIWSRQQLRKEQNEEWIEFPFVGLGLDFVANCRLDDEDFRWRAPQFQGPRTATERVEIDLVVAPNAGMFCGRVLDVNGVPLANGEPTFLINAASGRLEGEEVKLDADGRFHLPYQVREDQVPPYRFEIRRNDVTPTAGLAMPLAQLPEGRVLDLGDLRVDAFGEVAHGVVVDDRGEPIAGANIQLQHERLMPGKQQGQMRFVDEAFVTTESEEDGSYALFGELEPGRYRLRAQVRDHFPAEELVVGSGVAQTLKMIRKCRVVGTVLAPEWLGRKRVRVQLTPVTVPGSGAGQQAKPREDQLHDYAGKTYAYFDWVRPGIYSLTFRVRDFPDPFLRIDGLVIDPGQVDLHPLLTNLDLGAYIYRFQITTVDQNGQRMDPRRPQLARITRPNGEQTYVGLAIKGGQGEVLSASPQLEVVPMAAGYLAQPTVLPPGQSQLVFQAIPPVDLVLAGLHGMANGVNVQVVLERLENAGLPAQLDSFDGVSKRISGWYARARYSARMLDQNDTARVNVTSGGPHKVILRFAVGQGIRPPTVELDAVDVRIQPGGQPVRIPVGFDQAVVQQAIGEAARLLEAR